MSLELFAQKPLLGHGPSGFSDAVTSLLTADWFQRAEPGNILDSPHNLFFQTLVSTGVIGTAAGLGCIAVMVLFIVRRIKASEGPSGDLVLAATAALAVGAGGLLTHVSSPQITVAMAVCLGIVCSTWSPPANKKRPTAIHPALAPTLSVALGAFMLTGVIAEHQAYRGHQAAAQGSSGTAAMAFTSAHSWRPWDADLSMDAASSLARTNQHLSSRVNSPARSWAHQAVEAVPRSSRAQEITGMAALLDEDSAAAQQHLTAAVELSPADPRIRYELGRLHAMTEDFVTARAHLLIAARSAPESEAVAALLQEICRVDSSPQCP